MFLDPVHILSVKDLDLSAGLKGDDQREIGWVLIPDVGAFARRMHIYYLVEAQFHRFSFAGGWSVIIQTQDIFGFTHWNSLDSARVKEHNRKSYE